MKEERNRAEYERHAERCRADAGAAGMDPDRAVVPYMAQYGVGRVEPPEKRVKRSGHSTPENQSTPAGSPHAS
eukprot:11477994-Karenia_brevis.AAC.1